MAWKVEFTDEAEDSLDRLDRQVAKRILRFLHDRVALLENPRTIAAPLAGERYKGLFRYRVGDYRLICDIQDQLVTILVVQLGHRSRVYDR